MISNLVPPSVHTRLMTIINKFFNSYKSFLYYVFFTVFLLILEGILEVNFNSIVIFIIDFYINFIFIGAFYYYYRKNNKSYQIVFIFFLFKYIHIMFKIPWSLNLFASLFDYNSFLLSIDSFIHLNLSVLNFFFSFLSGFVDLFLLICAYRLILLLTASTNIKFLIQREVFQSFKLNILAIKQSFVTGKFSQKIKIVLFGFIIIITPLIYSNTVQSVNESNQGIYYLSEAVTRLYNYFQNNSDVSGIISNANNLLPIKNDLYFAGKYFEESSFHLESLNSPIYWPIEYLFGLKDTTDKIPGLIHQIGEFVGETMLNLVASIEDYLTFMDQLTKEILRRAYWWELDLATYNPQIDFYSRFDSKIPLNLDTNVANFKTGFSNLDGAFIQIGLNQNAFFIKFNNQMNKFSLILDQVVFLAKLAPPLLNATFTSVEVMNALAFDQFVSAKSLTTLSQRYLDNSQNLLNNNSFDITLSPIIANIDKIMREFNDINHEFVNMTASAQNMFIALSKSVILLNNTTYNNKMYDINQTKINNDIDDTNYIVKQIVERNIQKLTTYINSTDNLLNFPFRDILSQFLWFYQGYYGAVNGYKNLWLTTSGTMDLFSELAVQQQATNQFIESYLNKSQSPIIDIQNYNTLLDNYTSIQINQQYIGTLLNGSVTNGAIKTNLSLFENLLGYNKTYNIELNSGMNEFLNETITFFKSVDTEYSFTNYNSSYNNYTSTYLPLLQDLSGQGIFLNLSEQLDNATA